MIFQSHIKVFWSVLFFIGIHSLFTACTSYPVTDYDREWQYTDLRILDPAEALDSSSDLIALYTRTIGSDLQIRIDMLDQDPLINFDIYIAIDSQPGGTTDLPIELHAEFEWDQLLYIPSSGEIRVLDNNNSSLDNLGVRVLRDPILDTIDIKLIRPALLGANQSPWSTPHLKLQTILTPARESLVLDKSEPFLFEGRPPDPVRLVFAFWNTFPAYSPSMALRKWDGAHTGPMGGRHGLFNLLQASETYEIPLFLLDAASPDSLISLDFTGGLDLIKNLKSQDLLELSLPFPDQKYSPLPIPPNQTAQVIHDTENLMHEFNLRSPTTFYLPSYNPDVGETKFIFEKIIPENVGDCCLPSHLERRADRLIIPVFDYAKSASNQQADNFGLTLNVRRSLINLATNSFGDKRRRINSFIALGGDLPSSTWGIPGMAQDSFRYIRSHPWIKVMDFEELVTLKPHSQDHQTNQVIAQDDLEPDFASSYDYEPSLFAALEGLPNNQISRAAWQSYLGLFNPIYPPSPELPLLRRNYISNLWTLILAAHWAAQPYRSIDCSQDFDRDGDTECSLSNGEFFVVLEPQGGVITFAFARTASMVHQLIGPSSQFIIGTSDPIFWDLSGGIFADPYTLPGAFFDKGTLYNSAKIPDGLMLTSSDGSLNKYIRLFPGSIRIDYRQNFSPKHVEVNIPLVIDPWRRYTAGWRDLYYSKFTPDSLLVGLKPGPHWVISSSGNLKVDAFFDSIAYFRDTEDPNQDYPRGHLLPFPIMQVNISSDRDFYTEFRLDE